MRDFSFAVRTLRKNFGLSTVVVLSLGLGIGANTAIFSVVNALLLNPLPYPQPERLANIWLRSPGLGIFRDWPSPGQYMDLRNENHSFEETALAQLRTMTVTGLGQPQRVNAIRTQSALLPMLGAKPMMGRLLLPEEDAPGKPRAAVLTYALWRRLYSSDPTAVGKVITLNGNPYTIDGVLTRDFSISAEAMPSEDPMDKADLFLSMPLGPDALANRGDENYNIVVRLRRGVTVAQAQKDVDAIAARIRVKDKRDRTFGMWVVGLQDQVVGDVRRALLVLLGSVALVLLIACANVANLLLTRAAGRQKEIAIRTALGANASRIVRQLLTESLVLAGMGGVAGLLVARLALAVVRTMNPGNIPRLDEIEIRGPVLAFTFGVSVMTGILFGMAPAWRAVRTDLNKPLKAGGRSGSDGGLRLGRNRLRGLLVVSELALSLVLLVGAGLLLRSFTRLQGVSPGFVADHLLTMSVGITGPNYRTDKEVAQFTHDILERVGRLSGVKAAAMNSSLPLTGAVGWGGVNVEGYAPPPGEELQVDMRITTPDYFRAMGIPLLKGRAFSDRDTEESERAAIIDERFAQRFWPKDNPIGKHIWYNPKKPLTIVGVVGSVKQESLNSDSKIVAYFPYQQGTGGGGYLVVKTAGPAEITGAVIREIHAVNPVAVVFDVATMETRVSRSVARERFAAAMLGGFALFALLLAGVGVYGVMSYLVARSTHDIGVRMALGARPGSILGLVVRQGMELTLLGLVGGLGGAIALTRLMASLLFGVTATDGMTFSTVVVLLAMVALAATVIPAQRAMRVDPMTALREE
jgi:predicted permease